MSDPISNLLTSIRNAQAVHKETVLVPYSKINLGIVKIMESHELVKEVSVKGRRGGKVIELGLFYDGGFPRIKHIGRVSKLSKRVYKPYGKIKTSPHSRGIQIVSTPKGMMTGKGAVKEKVGGEIICEVW